MAGLGCKHCDYTGSVVEGGDRTWVSGGIVYDNETVFDCPYCSPDPDLDDLLDDSGDAFDDEYEYDDLTQDGYDEEFSFEEEVGAY